MSAAPSSPRVSVGLGSCSTRALAVVTNKWYREQRRAEQDVTRSLTLLKQRKISCILKAESLQRGLGREEGGLEGAENIQKELEEVERKMEELEKEREEKCKKIMVRRIHQVNTLQELGLLEAVGKESMRSRSDSEMKENELLRSSPAFSTSKYSPASSSSSHASRRLTPPLFASRLRAGSDPSISRPDPSCRLERGGEEKGGKGSKLSPRLGRRNPLRMLSNAIDFRTRRKQRPKSADFECVDEVDGKPLARSTKSGSESLRSSSVTDILDIVNTTETSLQPLGRLPPRVLEGRNSAPDILPSNPLDRGSRARLRLSAAASAKQKLSTRFQPQRKPAHRLVQSASVKRAKTFNVGAAAHPTLQSVYKTLPKPGSSRSLVSSSGSSTASHSSSCSRKSSDSSSISETGSKGEISQDALEEIAAFEKFIDEYFENVDNNNIPKPKIGKRPSPVHLHGIKTKSKVSSCSTLSEVLELSI